jgi:hypothetical protein
MQNLKRIPYISSLILLAYMPFHIFLSQWLSTYSGGLDLWKIGKDIVLMMLVVFTICLVWWQGKGNKLFNGLVVFTGLYGALHVILWAVHPDIYRRSAELGIIYNMRLPLCAILGYGASLLVPKFAFSSITKAILIISTIVAALGIIQYFLHSDFLTHFGYSIQRGARPTFTIDTNNSLIRIMSTLREPNALGAYLILPASLLAAGLLRTKDKNKQMLLGGMLGLHLLAILLTYSRSAWLGVVVAVAIIVWRQSRSQITAVIQRFWLVAAAVVVLMTAGLFALRNTTFFQQYVIHSNPTEQAVDLDSNDYHKLLVEQGLKGIRQEPLGHGPGTAGLASIQNPKGGQLTENYYVQIGYEVGVLGLLLFIGLNVWMYIRIWRRRDYIAAALCASFWAYVLANMLLHTWSNEAVAAQWWILAGMALINEHIPE